GYENLPARFQEDGKLISAFGFRASFGFRISNFVFNDSFAPFQLTSIRVISGRIFASDVETPFSSHPRLVSARARNRRLFRRGPADDGGKFGAAAAQREHHPAGGQLVA